jgi:uncharacterized repeat protein (TIGR01451 family)
MRRLSILVLALLAAAPALGYVVNDTSDLADATPGDNICDAGAGLCTLRAAIQEANATAGTQPITFSVAGIFQPATAYPPLTGRVDIDGTTAPGYAGVPVVWIDGASVATGLAFSGGSENSTLTGLQIFGCTFSGVSIFANGVTLRRNYIGPVTQGTANLQGVFIAVGENVVIGGADGEGNVISGNTQHGIHMQDGTMTVRDNRIGTTADGTAARPNGIGIEIFSANAFTIGSSVAAEGNVISGNGNDGIRLNGSTGGTVAGNFIGMNAGGTAAVPNGNGIRLTAGSFNNAIGTAGARNIISGNTEFGVWLETAGANTIAGNYIGTDVTGTLPFGNSIGVFVQSSGSTIGTAALGNLISGNGNGIEITGTSNTNVRGNNIGLDVTGTAGIGNSSFGIFINTSQNVVIGGVAAGEGNTISFNGQDGIGMDTATNAQVHGNTIGLNAAGTSTLGNGAAGITIFQSTNVIVGGISPAGARNVISGNSMSGIIIPAGSGHTIDNNYIGTNAAGTAAEGNLALGIEVINSNNNTIRRNLISGNAGHGIEVTMGSTGTIIHTNFIGLASDFTTSLGNGGDGINVCDFAANTLIGTLGGNSIAYNMQNGIGVEPTALLDNVWAGNFIYNNTLLGIDLHRDGVTANDAGDADTGANNLQNFPVIESAVTSPAGSQLRGTIHTTPNTLVTIHAYSSPPADPEGALQVGSPVSVTTDGSGNATWTMSGAPITVGHIATATATGPDGSSEFSAGLVVNPAPVVQFSTTLYTIDEGGGQLITVTRTGDLTAISDVNFAASDNTATAGSDYGAVAGTMRFNPGENSRTFLVATIEDALDEPAELVTLTLSSPVGATLGAPSVAQLEITDDDPPPVVSIGDFALAEGNTGPVNFTFTVSLNAVSGQQVQVNFATADDTATTSNVDYTAAAGTATIPAGSLSTLVTVVVNGDVIVEPNETFFLNLTAPVNATLGDAQALGTITNDEGVPSITIGDMSANEGGTITFTLTLSAQSATPVTVDYATANGTATAGSDYTTASGTATLAPLATSTTVVVATTADTAFEPDETFFVNLTNPVGAAVGDNQAVGTILNDDPQVANLGISKTANPMAYAPGQQITFTITVTNAGPDSAVNTVVTDVLPAGTTLVSSTCTGTTTLTCNLGTILNGATATATIVVTGNGTAPITNTATVTSASVDPAGGNNTGSVTVAAAAPAETAPVPTASTWALIILGAAIAIFAMRRI